MKGTYQGQFPHRGKTECLRSRGKGAVGMDKVQIDHPDTAPVMGIQHGLADLILLHTWHTAPYILHQLEGKPALETCIIHRSHHGNLVPHFAKCLGISLDHPAHAIHNRQKCICKLTDLQHRIHLHTY